MESHLQELYENNKLIFMWWLNGGYYNTEYKYFIINYAFKSDFNKFSNIVTFS